MFVLSEERELTIGTRGGPHVHHYQREDIRICFCPVVRSSLLITVLVGGAPFYRAMGVDIPVRPGPVEQE